MNPFMKNAKDTRGMAPLHLASSKGHIDCVKWLAVSGVDLAEETPTGYTAMHLAAMNGHVNCMMVSVERNGFELYECIVGMRGSEGSVAQFIFIRPCISDGPATGDFPRALNQITQATSFVLSILFLVQRFKNVYYRNKNAK